MEVLKQTIQNAHDEIACTLENLIDAWSCYKSEPFMSGKIEGAELALGVVKKVLTQAIVACSETEDPNE